MFASNREGGRRNLFPHFHCSSLFRSKTLDFLLRIRSPDGGSPGGAFSRMWRLVCGDRTSAKKMWSRCSTAADAGSMVAGATVLRQRTV